MSSIRHVTTQQFSDGTTIDGDRLEKALQDLQNYINNVPDGDFRQRWFQNQIVLKYLPYTAEADTNYAAVGPGTRVQAPFLSVYNTGAGTTNAYRLKGNRLPWQDQFVGATPSQVAWTTTLAIGDEPAIIESVDISLNSYTTEYTNDFNYGN